MRNLNDIRYKRLVDPNGKWLNLILQHRVIGENGVVKWVDVPIENELAHECDDCNSIVTLGNSYTYPEDVGDIKRCKECYKEHDLYELYNKRVN